MRGCSTPAAARSAPAAPASRDATALDLAGLHPGLAGAEIVVACDVDNPLTGAAAPRRSTVRRRAPAPAEVELLDAGADPLGRRRRARHRRRPPRRTRAPEPPAGSASPRSPCSARELRPGIDLVLDLAGLPEPLAGADLVVTGEGALDEQTLHGKAPAGVAAVARDKGVPAVAVAGQVTLTAGSLLRPGCTRHTRSSTRRAPGRRRWMRPGRCSNASVRASRASTSEVRCEVREGGPAGCRDPRGGRGRRGPARPARSDRRRGCEVPRQARRRRHRCAATPSAW